MNALENVTAVILAGGVGSRLRAVVSDRPKVMALIHGRPFISFLLRQVKAAGVKETVLCTGYMAEFIEERLGATFQGMRLAYSREETALGTAGALRHALPKIATSTILVMNGDSYCDLSLSEFASAHASRETDASMVLARVEDTSRYGRVELGDSGYVKRFVEKGPSSGPGWINAGVYLLNRSAVAGIPRDRAVSIEREVFPGLVGRGLYGHPGGRFLDIGTPESYREAERFFESETA